MVKILSWNIARREKAWQYLLDTDYDIALLQEVSEPPADVKKKLGIDSAPWRTAGSGLERNWRTAIVKLSDRVDVQWLEAKSIGDAQPGELAVSRLGTLSAAIITPVEGDPFVAISVYAPWEKPHNSTDSSWIYADGSAHRIISDLSTFIGQEKNHRLLVAGDLNILHGYGENGSQYWADRYASVFSRMEALGLSFVGPQAPFGRWANPWPDELPQTSTNVPTFHTNRQTPATAARQLDYVFASNHLSKHVSVRALNETDQWGPSDHCRVEIDIA